MQIQATLEFADISNKTYIRNLISKNDLKNIFWIDPYFYKTMQVEYNILLPLIDAWRKTDDLPREVMHTDKKILDMIYKSQTNLSTQEYIKAVTVDILKQLKTKLPYANENYVLRYIRKKAGQEKEAYQISLDFLKDILNIKGHTDLDYRILLYDEFEKAIDSMLK